VFQLSFIAAELRRRRGRTLLTALGLGVGIALVVTVSALSAGLDQAQSKVLKPLTGVGTDMTVTRPITVSGSGTGGGPFGNLSPKEQQQLQKENGPSRFNLNAQGKAGSHFERDSFVSAQLSFSQDEVARAAATDGVESAAGSLTLTSLHISGKVPTQSEGGGGVVTQGQPPTNGTPPPNPIGVQPLTVTGVDQTQPDLAPVTPSQIVKGSYLTAAGGYQAVLSSSYAKRHKLGVGDTVKLGGKTFTVVGISSAPLGGTSSDIYVLLTVLQKLSDRAGRVNAIQVRASDSGQVQAVAKRIESQFDGAQVTTAADLADRVGGSLSDARNLSDKLGTALQLVGLAGAVVIACLLTLASVAKRTRELGTLKAIGWPQRMVVGQVAGESLAQGLLGGVFGALLGLGAARLIAAYGPTLKATVDGAAQNGGPGGPFGLGQVQTVAGSTTVALGAPVDLGLIGLAVGLAVLGGLIAGSVGGLRASRLRPADALRHLD